MKRRTICFILSICIVVSLLMGMTSVAYAEKDYSEFVQKVVVASGDTVSSICTSKGMQYGNVKDAIIIVNKFVSESSLAAIHPGQEISIPISEAAAAAIVYKATTIIPARIPSSSVKVYTVSSGDTMNKICDKCGLDYQTCKNVIMKLNGWGNAGKLDSIYPNQEIILPSSDATAQVIQMTILAAENENADVVSTTAKAGDSFQYYLIKHVMPKGGTLKSVSNSLGVEYNEKIEKQLLALNGLSNANNVKAGVSYYFLSSTAEENGYAVYSHKVVSGDTISDLSKTYGVKYAAGEDILSGLNPDVKKLTSIKKGSTILLVSKSIAETETPIVIY